MSSCGSNVETSTPLVSAIVNDTVTLQLKYLSDAASSHSHPAYLYGSLAAPYFVIKCTEARAGC